MGNTVKISFAMKLLPFLIGAISAGNEVWPASNWKDGTCGAVHEMPMASNSTCEVSLAKGQAAWVNAGGSFITQASTSTDTFYIHTYDGHGESDRVRFVTWFSIPYIWPRSVKPGQVPPEWDAACGTTDDISIYCIDNGGRVEGKFMAAFNYAPGNNKGVKQIPVMNTAGHSAGTMYSFELNNRKYESVAVESIEVQANATVIADVDLDGNYYADNGKFAVILTDDYNGQLLYVGFKHKNPDDVHFFGGAQAFYSTVN